MASNQEHVFVNLANEPQATLTEMSAFFTEANKRRMGKVEDAFIFGAFSLFGKMAADNFIDRIQKKRRIKWHFKNNSVTKKK